jgi:hypothetical protein
MIRRRDYEDVIWVLPGVFDVQCFEVGACTLAAVVELRGSYLSDKEIRKALHNASSAGTSIKLTVVRA